MQAVISFFREPDDADAPSLPPQEAPPELIEAEPPYFLALLAHLKQRQQLHEAAEAGRDDGKQN